MISVNSTLTVLALIWVLLFPSSSTAITDSGELVTQRGSIDDDYYAAADTIDLDAEVFGDVTVAGGDITLRHLIRGDLTAAGGSIRIRGKILDDIRTAGGDIDIEADIGDDLIASGGKIRIATNTTIGGDAWLAGGDVRMAGVINNDLVVAAGHVSLSGAVHGKVEIRGGEIEILDSARIDGDLTYSSPQPASIAAGASIRGQVTHHQVDWDEPSGGFGLFFSVTLIVASIVLFKLFPQFTLSAAGRISADPWQSFGLGIALLILTPLVALLLIGILLGVWVGLSLMALYFVTLLTGFLVSLFFLGDRGARLFNQELKTTGRRIMSVVLAIILLALVKLIPVIGGLLLVVLLLLGTGAAVLQVRMGYMQSGKA